MMMDTWHERGGGPAALIWKAALEACKRVCRPTSSRWQQTYPFQIVVHRDVMDDETNRQNGRYNNMLME